MLEYLLQELTKLRWFIIVAIVAIVLFYVVALVLTKKFEFNDFKIRVFSTLFDMDIKVQIATAILLSRLLIVILSSIFCKDINLGHLISLVVMTLAISLLLKNYKILISDLLSYLILYVINYLQSALFKFYLNVEKYSLYIIMIVALGLFIDFFAVYNSMTTYNSIIEMAVKKPEKKETSLNG